ncbi:hypothetical protein B296_00028483 [Ensete ventricosum]|uniref:AAA+ ATPase domain-containing protein n=1 Tax=Ensete ventricosum TaxID=4639 RepID=A0A427AMK4_ENSVE|nr:hypothetical protein B296_00028483 [Ensete ventricosum]
MATLRSVMLASAVASAALAVEHAYADGAPFNFSPFNSYTSREAPPAQASAPDRPAADVPPAEVPRVRNDNPRTTASGFDPEALERGAKALREINSSPQAKKVACRDQVRRFFVVFELMRKQEETRQVELAAKKAEFQAVQAQHETLFVKSGVVLDLTVFCIIFVIREGARVVWGYVDRILGQPSLIRESSRGKYPWSGFFSRIVISASNKTMKGNDAGKKATGFGDVILNPSLQKRIEQLASATANTKNHQAPFRNMLFYGPPGTGKTMAARELAHKSGLDYALMTGGDVAPLGSQAVTKIHQLFDWAKKSKRGLLLFIDEADAFLCE